MNEIDEVILNVIGLRPGAFCDLSAELMLMRIRNALSEIGFMASTEEIADSMARNGISISEKANSNGTHWLIWEAPSQEVNMSLSIGEHE